jgi:hypothetical protein
MANPSKYRKEFPEMLTAHFQKGYSFESFGALVHVDKTTMYDWLKVHPEFKAAKEQGVLKSLLYWEKIGINAVMGQIQGFQPSTYIYTMKCRFRKFGYNEQVPSDDGDQGVESGIENESTAALIDMFKNRRKAGA